MHAQKKRGNKNPIWFSFTLKQSNVEWVKIEIFFVNYKKELEDNKNHTSTSHIWAAKRK